MANAKPILRPFYIYDPNVSDTLGGLSVKSGDKGKFVLATDQMIQYWKDQGLIGDKPVGEISAAHKKLLKQITRGRSDDNEASPKRVPKYSKAAQSGAPGFAGLLASAKPKKKAKTNGKKSAPPKTTTPTSAPAANSRLT